MTITEVGKLFDMTADTLRYYERIGLVPKVRRGSSGVRDYSEDDINWVKFIKCMRSAGISIEVLVEYVAMFQEGRQTITARKELLIDQRKTLATKIEEMVETLQRLDEKIDGYEERMLKCEEELLGKGTN